MPVNSVFSIAKSSLFAHQQALAITSTNLANANNPNYSRQVTMFGATAPDHRAKFSFGTGVAVQDVMRIRSSVTDLQIRTNNHSFFDSQKRATTLQQVESLFSEPSEFGISNLMAEFFNSWDELALDPTSISLRTSVVQSAQMLSEKIESVHSGISQLKRDIKTEANEIVDNINSIVKQLNTVNMQIYDASVVNSNTNDLIDKRDSLLEELSEFVNINVSIDENDVANVAIGGVFAVDGLHYKQFKISQEGDRISLSTSNGEANATLSGGSLNGIIELFNKEFPNQLETLDSLATTLMENVNQIHAEGYTLTDPSLTGIQFFTGYENGKLEVNDELVRDPFYLAISTDGTDGDNSIALRLAELRNSNLIEGKSLSETYSEFVSTVANDIRLQEQNAESYSLVLNQLQQTKLETSGVSTDEEMMNVMKYQQSYDAAAKLITIADELMQTLLTLV